MEIFASFLEQAGGVAVPLIQKAGGIENIYKYGVLAIVGILGANLVASLFSKFSYGFILNMVIGIAGAVGALYLLQVHLDMGAVAIMKEFENDVNIIAILQLAGFGLCGALLLSFFLGLLKAPFAK